MVPFRSKTISLLVDMPIQAGVPQPLQVSSSRMISAVASVRFRSSDQSLGLPVIIVSGGTFQALAVFSRGRTQADFLHVRASARKPGIELVGPVARCRQPVTHR